MGCSRGVYLAWPGHRPTGAQAAPGPAAARASIALCKDDAGHLRPISAPVGSMLGAVEIPAEHQSWFSAGVVPQRKRSLSDPCRLHLDKCGPKQGHTSLLLARCPRFLRSWGLRRFSSLLASVEGDAAAAGTRPSPCPARKLKCRLLSPALSNRRRCVCRLGSLTLAKPSELPAAVSQPCFLVGGKVLPVFRLMVRSRALRAAHVALHCHGRTGRWGAFGRDFFFLNCLMRTGSGPAPVGQRADKTVWASTQFICGHAG